jgi:hypothetical protein
VNEPPQKQFKIFLMVTLPIAPCMREASLLSTLVYLYNIGKCSPTICVHPRSYPGIDPPRGFVWAEDGLPEENMEDDGARERFARFWGVCIVVNRNSLLPPAKIPPIALPPDLQTNIQDHLTSILNRVQVHLSYCLCR